MKLRNTFLIVVLVSVASGFCGAMIYDYYKSTFVNKKPVNTIVSESDSKIRSEDANIAESKKQSAKGYDSEVSKKRIRNDQACQMLHMEYASSTMQAQRALDAKRDGSIISSQFGYGESTKRARRAYARLLNMGCKVPEY